MTKCSMCKKDLSHPLCEFRSKLTHNMKVAMVKTGDEVYLFTSLPDAHHFAHGLPESVIEWKEVKPLGVAGCKEIMEGDEE